MVTATAPAATAAYDALTQGRSRFLRVDELCRQASERFPGITPSVQDLQSEAPLEQRHKKGLEKLQGQFLADVLADPDAGTHLCHAMLLPPPQALALLPEFEKIGEVSLPGAHLKRQGK